VGVLEHLHQEEHDLEAMGEVEEPRPLLEALVAEAEVGMYLMEAREAVVVEDCQLREGVEQDGLMVEEGAVEEERLNSESWEATVVA
jgi:hypothetical protein